MVVHNGGQQDIATHRVVLDASISRLNAGARALATVASPALIFAIAGCTLLPMAPPSPPPVLPPSADLTVFSRAALQGDLRSGLVALGRIKPGTLTEKDRATRECVLKRFQPGASVAVPSDLPVAAASTLAAYRRYWTSVMLKQLAPAEAEAILRRELAVIVPDEPGLDRGDIEAVTDATKRYLETLGLHALTGMTRPLYELMLWRKETIQRYPVQLPEGPVEVTVVFMEDFASRGWTAYATCDRVGTGGWAESDRLFAVSESYNRESEAFRVSYLAHEGQHFADYKAFPKLEQPELEYRAKLTELAVSQSTTRQLLRGFLRGAQRGRDVPHGHAEYWIARELSVRLLGASEIETRDSIWNAVDESRVRDEALRLLRESGDKARSLGAATVTRWLPD